MMNMLNIRSQVSGGINDYRREHGHTPKGVVEDIILQILSDTKQKHKLNISKKKKLKTNIYKEFF